MNSKLDKTTKIIKLSILSLLSIFFLAGLFVIGEVYYALHPELGRKDRAVLRECKKAVTKNIDFDFEKIVLEDFDCVYIIAGEIILNQSGIDVSGDERTSSEHICFVKDNRVIKQINLFYCFFDTQTAAEVKFAFRKDNGSGEKFSIDEPKIMKFERGDTKFKIDYRKPNNQRRHETFVLYREGAYK